MKNGKKIIIATLVLVAVSSLAFMGIKAVSYLSGPKIEVDSPVISTSVDENGNPVDILADKKESKEDEVLIIPKDTGAVIASAKRTRFINLKTAYIRLYYLCEYDENVCVTGKEDCTWNDQTFPYDGKKLFEVPCDLTSSNYYNLVIDNIDELKAGRYRVDFMDGGKVRNTSIEFIIAD